MAKFQWTAASETLGQPPSLLTNVCDGDITDWEIVAEPNALGGRALKLVALSGGFRRRLALPGTAPADQRVDVRARFYKATNNVTGGHVAIRNKGTTASDSYDHLFFISSSGIPQLYKYKGTAFDQIAPGSGIASGNRVGWWNLRLTYQPAGSSPRLQATLWNDSQSEESPQSVISTDSAALVDAAVVDGERICIGTTSSATEYNGLMFDWVTVGTEGDDADVQPVEGAAELAGAALVSIAASADLTTVPAGIPLEGSAQVSASASGDLTTTPGDSITVVTDVDAGNIDATQVVITGGATDTPLVEVKVRAPLTGWTHFCFAVEDAEGKRPTFRVSREYIGIGSLSTAWRPTWTQDGVNWTQAPSRTVVTSPSPGYIEWQFTDPLPDGRVFITSGPIGRQVDGENFAALLLSTYPENASPTVSADENGVYNTSPSETDDLGRQIGGHPMYAIKLSWPGPTTDGARKRKIVLLGGTHAAGESLAFWEMRAFALAALNDSSPAAQAFRANWDVYLYWHLTPNGVYGGHRRTNFRSSQDPNRFWEGGATPLQEVAATQAAMIADTGGAADVMFSWHGWPGSDNPFTFWTNPENANPETRSPLYQATIDGAAAYYGTQPQVVESTNTGTSTTWAKNVLGTPLAFTVEAGLAGPLTPSVHESIGTAWLYGVQYADSLGLFVEPPDTLAGASLIATTASGSLSTGIALEGSASSVTLADGVLTIGIRLRGDALSQAIASAGLTTAIQLAADAQASAQAAGALTTQPAGMAADATVAALATGSLTVHIRIAADAVAQVLAQADLTVPGAPAELEAHASVLAIAEGGLITAIRLEGAAASFAQADGTLDMALTMRADAFVQVMASGVLSTQIRMDAAAVASAIAAASLTTSGAPLAAHGARRATFRGYQRITSRRPRQYA